MIPTRLTPLLVLAPIFCTMTPAHAEDDVSAGKDDFLVAITDGQTGTEHPDLASANGTTPAASSQPAMPSCADAPLLVDCAPVTMACLPFAESPTGHVLLVDSGEFGEKLGWCSPDNGEVAAAEPARITPGRVLQAFRRIPLPAAKLDIQPPGGKTLVNLDTIFSTTTGDLDRTITLLGRRVQLRITPASYTWHHGDGTTQTSDWPGRPWEKDLDMDVYLTHSYEDAHVTVRPSVDVTYAADYRIGNGPWQPVDGTVTLEGPPSALRILEARPVLTGDGH